MAFIGLTMIGNTNNNGPFQSINSLLLGKYYSADYLRTLKLSNTVGVNKTETNP